MDKSKVIFGNKMSRATYKKAVRGKKGYVKVVERPFGMTTRRGVFAGGDVVHRPQTVVLAMKAAKEVAQGIAQYVDAIKLLEEAKRIEKEGV